jgi:hypothetical protein
MANILVKQKILSLMIGAAATALGTQALAEITQPSNTSPENVDEIIVTGTPNGEGIKKLDASFSITTVNADAIQQVSPASSADFRGFPLNLPVVFQALIFLFAACQVQVMLITSPFPLTACQLTMIQHYPLWITQHCSALTAPSITWKPCAAAQARFFPTGK